MSEHRNFLRKFLDFRNWLGNQVLMLDWDKGKVKSCQLTNFSSMEPTTVDYSVSSDSALADDQKWLWRKFFNDSWAVLETSATLF